MKDLDTATRARYVFLLLAGLLSLILYLDRVCISESADAIAGELRLDDVQRGWMFSAFTLGYLIFEVPSGNWGDRFGARRVLCRIVLGWSLFTMLTGCVSRLPGGGGFVGLLLVRFLFGVAEAGAYPNLAKCTGQWFPLRERGFAQGVIATAGFVGGGLASGLTIAVTGWVDAHVRAGLGWRASFWLFGLVGGVWAVLFAWWFRDRPEEHPAVNAAELAWIRAGQGGAERPAGDHGLRVPWRLLLRNVNLWAFAAMALFSGFVVYLYLTRFPQYLAERHHLDRQRWGWAAGVPLICGAAGCALGGVLTDYLVRRTGSRRWGRRVLGLVGKGGGAVLLVAGAQAEDPAAALVLLALSALAGNLALAPLWAVCTDAGGQFVGTVFGVVNTAAAVGAVLSPVVAGYVLNGLAPPSPDGTFDPAARAHAWDVVLYLFAAALAVSGVCWLRIDAEESLVGE
jgi:ACS family glucarate transporter-like MFS transporter